MTLPRYAHSGRHVADGLDFENLFRIRPLSTRYLPQHLLHSSALYNSFCLFSFVDASCFKILLSSFTGMLAWRVNATNPAVVCLSSFTRTYDIGGIGRRCMAEEHWAVWRICASHDLVYKP